MNDAISELAGLADRVDGLSGHSNELDVLVEIALFEPDQTALSVRANDAGTKVIYTSPDGSEQTCWAIDWTVAPSIRRATAAALRAKASQ